ncbi:type IV conjugative transfer system protein TraE [Hippea maritima]|uniref:Conserved hypothetical sex pilus assembly and synthesis protein n=1 Tax=Hippea maritima (strain ATCC 700847 / DSM 10411 / MH2) TaxID=760142 RepID=F2LV23_HIPMA|nr:type IV conjugative transfer system protein TraE [Hippea maritima]AEA33607.1 conserved hypothetical sex pilus assembly and synthesis protein [Hippea maritima DSM 10411]
MRFKIYMNELANAKHNNRLLKFVIVVMAVAIVFSFYYIDRIVTREKIVLLPPEVHSKMVFIGDRPSKSYFDEMTRYVVSLALDYTSATARGQFAELLTLFAPSSFKEYQQVFYNLADRLEAAGNISNVFYINEIKLYPKKGKIVVIGMNYTYSANSLLSQETREYQIGYKVQNGRFFITSFGRVQKEAGK